MRKLVLFKVKCRIILKGACNIPDSILRKIFDTNFYSINHLIVCNLAFTHLIMEGIAVVTNRELSQSHPIFRLLAPHFLFLLAINRYVL